MDNLIITAAIVGSSPTKEMNPAVPYTPKEIADSAIECWNAGASIAHIHVRDPKTGKPESKIELFGEVLDRIRTDTDMIVNLTTSGLNLTGSEDELIEKRLEPVVLHPDICSLDVGSMNFGKSVFLNSPKWAETAAMRMKEAGVKPEIEVFDLGHLRQAKHLMDLNLIQNPPLFQLCMGIKWGMEATHENLVHIHQQLPTNSVWSVLGVGASQIPMTTMALSMGGHVRVGFEDNIYLQKGTLAPSNSAFVERTVKLSNLMGRDVASPSETRSILGPDIIKK